MFARLFAALPSSLSRSFWVVNYEWRCFGRQISLLHNAASEEKRFELYGYLLKKPLNIAQLVQIHASMVVSGMHQDDALITQLIASIIGAGKVEKALTVFERVKCPSAFLWTSMMRGYSRCGRYGEVIVLYRQMKSQCMLPNNYMFPLALKACGSRKNLTEGEQIQADSIKLGFVSDVFVQTALLDMYVKCSQMKCAKCTFEDMAVKNVVSWTALLAGYCNHGLLDQAQELFHDMPTRNTVTWNVIIDGLSRFGQLSKAREYFNKMPQRSVVSWTSMIDGYSKIQDLASARVLFDQMGEKEVVAWTAMISCYADNGKPTDAIHLFREMQATGIKADEVTMLTVISAVTEIGNLGLCDWIDNCIDEGVLGSDIRILNARVNMYVQCGSIERALIVFHRMPRRDEVSYNSIIRGCATHGNADKALLMFSMMIEAGVQPNDITFTTVLTACANNGLVDEGHKYFSLMLELGHVEPQMEHYSCMVNLLGRAGYLDEAYNFILCMPLTPGASIWGALLGSCKIHGKLELAEVVAKRLFEMEPDNPGNYSVLANMYSEKNMWVKAGRTRGSMKNIGVVKVPGSSRAEVMEAKGSLEGA